MENAKHTKLKQIIIISRKHLESANHLERYYVIFRAKITNVGLPNLMKIP